MKIALVGATGFIGSSLADEFKSRNLEFESFSSTKPLYERATGKFNLQAETKFVIWAAGKLNPYIASTNAQLIHEELAYFREVVREFNGIPHDSKPNFILLSSGGCVYDGDSKLFDENCSALGINEYGRFKSEQERIIRESSVPNTILRLANVYGPKQEVKHGTGVISHWTNQVKIGGPIRIFGNSATTRDYIYISDVVDSVMCCIENFYGDEILNVGTGKGTSLIELAELFKILSQHEIEILQEQERLIDRTHCVLDISKIRKLFNWNAQVDLSKGIKLMLENHSDN